MSEQFTPNTDYLHRLFQRNGSLVKGALSSLMKGGQGTSKRIARSGIAFKELREYDVGDEIKHIHWNSSARAGRLLVKTYEEDVHERFFVLIDDSISMISGFQSPLYQHALNTVAYLFKKASDYNQPIGAATFSGSWKVPIEIRRSSKVSAVIGGLFTPTILGDTRSDSTHQYFFAKEKKLNIFILSDFNHNAVIAEKIPAHQHKIFLCHYDVSMDLPPSGLYEAASIINNRTQSFDFSSEKTHLFFKEKQKIKVNEIKKQHALRKSFFISMENSPEKSFQMLLK